MRHFKDKICVITGAGSGIGAACARAMAREGALIIGTDLRQDMLAETKARIEAAGGAMENFMVDVADRDAMFDLAATVEKQYGPRQRPCGQYFIHIRAYQRTDPERL